MAKTNISIHPRRPSLATLGIKVPKDSDGAYRAVNRIDGKILNLGMHSVKRGLASVGHEKAEDDESPAPYVSA